MPDASASPTPSAIPPEGAPQSAADILAQLPPEQAAALAPGLGVDLARVRLVQAEQAEASGPTPLPPTGGDPLTFKTVPTPAKLLRIDDQVYRCRAKIPGKVMRESLELIQRVGAVNPQALTEGDAAAVSMSLESFDVVERLIRAAMVPEDLARFLGRYDGTDLQHYTCTQDDTTGEWTITPTEGAPEVEPIDSTEFAMYGMRLITAYTARPTVGHEPSGS